MQDLPDLVIANATVVNADGRTNAHVLVTGGTIVELLEASIWARTFPRSRERR
jgi:dihydropyrimidinase